MIINDNRDKSNTLDLDDLIVESVVDIPSTNGTEPQPEQAPRRLLPFGELSSLPPLSWLIEPELPAHALAVLFGASGTGKSFVALDYALRVAQTANVVYIAAEGASGYAARALAWSQHHKLGYGGAYLWTEAVNLLDRAAVEAFIASVKELSPALIVVDTLARCMVGGDENSARDMGLFVASCDAIKNATGATVLVVHHTGKNGSSYRGSSALLGAADMMAELTNEDGLITIRCEKTKDAKPFERRYLRLVEWKTGRLLPNGDEETSCVVLPAERVITRGMMTESKRKILEVLALAVFERTGARSKQIIDSLDIPAKTIYRVLSELKKDGYLTQDNKGDPYYITEAGKAAIGLSHDM